MDITEKCVISTKHGFDLLNGNKFLIIEVTGKYMDKIHINKINGIRFKELVAAFESPKHEDHPIVDDENKLVVLGGTVTESKRTVCIMGK